jgi:hypothetical protein
VGWDANKTQFIRDLLTGGNDVAGRGMIAGMLGAPGDIAGLAENSLRGLIGKPQVQPWGGSEHIGQTLEQAGLVSDVRRPKTELLASLISPGAAAKTVLNAPKTAMTALRALDNLDSAPTMVRMGQRGAVDVGSGGRMSAADAKAAGYWHSVGDGKKLPKPIHEMSAVREPIRDLLPRKFISPESMYGGVIVPASGDRTIAGQLLKGVDGIKLPTPVELEGGADFMRTHSPTGAIWASDTGAITGLANRIREASKVSQDIYMPYNAMGHGSANFNTMMSDTLLEMIKGGKLSSKDIKAFDMAVRSQRPEWAGLMSPLAREQLNANGALRHAFVDRMQLDDFQKAGFPNIATARYAITEPALMDAPLHSSGFAISKVDPSGKVIKDPIAPHTTYNTQLGGEYVGGFEQQVPRDIMYPDWFKARRLENKPLGSDPRSFQLSNPIQPANQEWLDGVMGWLQANPAYP